MKQRQRTVINAMADAGEMTAASLQPVLKHLQDLWQAFKKWLNEHLHDIIAGLILLAFLALLYALWRLLRQAQAVTWLRTRLDYACLGILGRHAPEKAGADQFFKALERLFMLYDTPRPEFATAGEYLQQTVGVRNHMRLELMEMTRLFEDASYGADFGSEQKMLRMRELYCRIYRRIDE